MGLARLVRKAMCWMGYHKRIKHYNVRDFDGRGILAAGLNNWQAWAIGKHLPEITEDPMTLDIFVYGKRITRRQFRICENYATWLEMKSVEGRDVPNCLYCNHEF